MESVKEEIPLPQYSPTKQLNGVNSNLPAYQVTRSGAYYGTVESAGTPYRSTEFPVLLVGGCPVCRIGVLEEEFTWLGIMLGVVFFPIGILCCLSLRQRRCRNCGAVF